MLRYIGFIVFLSVALILFIRCNENNNKYKGIDLPLELFDDDNIYLGQKLSTIKKTRNLEDDRSGYGYAEELTDNKYFARAIYNDDYPGNILRSVSLESDQKDLNNYNNNLEKEIIELCINTFGENYKIVDAGQYLDIGESYPKLIWVLPDTGFVTFFFAPTAVFYRLRDIHKYKYISTSYILDISYSLSDYEKDLKESIAHTRETLGLE